MCQVRYRGWEEDHEEIGKEFRNYESATQEGTLGLIKEVSREKFLNHPTE